MDFRNFLLIEDTYGLGIIENIKPFIKDEGNFLIFSNDNTPQSIELFKQTNFDGIIGYPVKYIYWTLKREKLLKINNWAIKKYILIANISRGQILNIKDYNKNSEGYIKDQEILKKYFMKNISPKIKDSEKLWNTFIFSSAKKYPKSCYDRLFMLMKHISNHCECKINMLFREIGYTAIYSDKDQINFRTDNPEICFLNRRNLKIIQVLDNI